MKEPLPKEMIYITVDIPVSKDFRDSLLLTDPEFEGLGMMLSKLLLDELIRSGIYTKDVDETPNLTTGQVSNRYH